MSILDEVTQILARHESWLVLAHEKPDGDTFGCTAALASLGGRLGKKVLWGGRDEAPTRYAFLTGGMPYESFSRVPLDKIEKGTLIICVDTSTAERSVDGLTEAGAEYPILNIDHHADNKKFGTVNWLDADASATGEMITELLVSSGWGVSPFEAAALYAAIISDNGSFRFASTSIRSHLCAIELLKAGACPSEIAKEIDSSLSVGALRLWGRALSRAETFSDGKAALFWLREDDFSATGSSQADTENLVNFLLRVKGVQLAALLSEAGEEARVSLRARAPMNARAVAQLYGGGGHDLAAGYRIRGSVPSILSALRGVMEAHIEDRLACDR